MYEKRYHDSIGVSELYKMKDVVGITEEETGRMVQLHLYQAGLSRFLYYNKCDQCTFRLVDKFFIFKSLCNLVDGKKLVIML